MSESYLWSFVVVLALVAALAGARLYVARPRERPPRLEPPGGTEARAALSELLADPDGAAGREAEARSDWPAARTAYARALHVLGREDPTRPAVALKRRWLESKIEELERLGGG